MSISLLVTYDTDEQSLVPVASEQVFSDYWQPVCTQLHLQWLPLFQTGIPVSKEDIPTILSELNQLRTYFSTQMTSPETVELGAHIISRIERLSAELRKVIELNIRELYIG